MVLNRPLTPFIVAKNHDDNIFNFEKPKGFLENLKANLLKDCQGQCFYWIFSYMIMLVSLMVTFDVLCGFSNKITIQQYEYILMFEIFTCIVLFCAAKGILEKKPVYMIPMVIFQVIVIALYGFLGFHYWRPIVVSIIDTSELVNVSEINMKIAKNLSNIFCMTLYVIVFFFIVFMLIQLFKAIRSLRKEMKKRFKIHGDSIPFSLDDMSDDEEADAQPIIGSSGKKVGFILEKVFKNTTFYKPYA